MTENVRGTRLFVDQVHAAGAIVATPGALSLVPDLRPFIRRHLCGDWGRVGRLEDTDLTAAEDRDGAFATADDAKLNAHAIRHGGRTLSAYDVNGGVLWIITDGLEPGGLASEDTVTRALLPEDY